jgi:hypothetical protein
MLPRHSARVRVPLVRLLLPVDPDWVAARLHVPGSVSRLIVRQRRREGDDAVEELSTSPPDIDALWEHVEPTLSSYVIKDSTWWAWRYDGHPRRPYRHFVLRRGSKLCAVAVLRVRPGGDGQIGEVLDFFASDAESARAVVSRIRRDLDVSALMFFAPPRSPSVRLLGSAGFRSVPRVLDRDPLVLNMRDFGDNRRELAKAGWYVTYGDVDRF